MSPQSRPISTATGGEERGGGGGGGEEERGMVYCKNVGHVHSLVLARAHVTRRTLESPVSAIVLESRKPKRASVEISTQPIVSSLGNCISRKGHLYF